MALGRRPGLFKRLTEALFEDVHEVEAVAVEPPPGEPQVRSTSNAAIDVRLRDLARDVAAGTVPPVAGKLQLVDLTSIQAEVGDRWQSIAARAHDIATQTIERRLAPNDAFTPLEDESYLILFAELTAGQARLKAAAIAREVHQRLLGELNLSDKHWVKAYVTDLLQEQTNHGPSPIARLIAAFDDCAPLALDARPENPVAAAKESPAATGRATEHLSAREIALTHAKFEARFSQVADDRREGTAGKIQLLDLDRIRAELGDKWESVAAKVREIAEQVITHRLAPTDVFAPVNDDSYMILFAELTEEQARMKAGALAREIRERLLGEVDMPMQPQIGAFVSSVAKLQRQVEPPVNLASIDRAFADEEDCTDAGLGDADLQKRLGETGAVYRPTLYRPRAVVTIFDVQPLRLDQEHQILRGSKTYPDNDPPVAFEIDRAVLRRAVRDVGLMIAREVRAIVLAPVRLQSLVDQGSFQMVDLLRVATPEVQRHVVVELTDLVANAPTTRLAEGIAAVKPFCRSVTVRVGLGFTDFERIGRFGLSSAGFDLYGVEGANREIDRLKPYFRRFARLVHDQKMTAHAFGLETPAEVNAAIEAGFEYVNGPAVADDASRPMALHPFHAQISG